MTRWLSITNLVLISILLVVDSLAFEIPYGVQDPMHKPGFPTCSGGEIGHWQLLIRASSDGKDQMAYLALTTVDVLDPAFVICYVPADRKVLVMEPGRQS